MNISSRAAAAAAVVALTLALAACEPYEPGRIDSETPLPVPTAPATSTPDPSSTPAALVPFLTFADIDGDGTTVSASGGVDGTIDNGGTCTFSFTTKGGPAPVVITSTSISNATNTSCGVVHLPVASFSSGTWSAVLTYESVSGTGASEPLELEIP